MTKEKPAIVDDVPPHSRSDAFDYVRKAHQMETAEDYVELIADLIVEKGEARVVDLAEGFGVSHATVNKIILRLNKEGFVTNRPYRSLFLTAEGEKLAKKCKERHDVVYNFLRALGIVKNLRIAERSFKLGKAAAEFFNVRSEIHLSLWLRL